MRQSRARAGFTLAELLIVVAIIAVLTAIGIVTFRAQLEKTRQAVDMTTMRAAKAALVTEYMTGNSIQADGITKYYYDPAGSKVSTDSPAAGYGQSRTDARNWWSGDGTAVGLPNVGGSHPARLAMTITADGVVSYYWGGAYSGENVTTAAEHQTLSAADRVQKDVLLLDSLQGEFRGMTYGALKELLLNPDGTFKAGLTTGKLGSDLCVVIANGTINSSGQVVSGAKKTEIYLPEIFQSTGFDTSLPVEETYIINSVDTKTNTIWLNLRISESEFKNLSSSSAKWDQTAAKAYTYVKSDGAVTPDPLREAVRKNS